MGSVTHCQAAWGLWAVEIVLRTAALPEGSGEEEEEEEERLPRSHVR